MPKVTINGKEVEVEAGTTVIQAFQKAGTAIAHYCWHEGLSIAGVCRMCMVEVEGMPRPQIACNLQVTDGMKVRNDTEKIKDVVKWTLDFHLINHPLDCPICDQAGECKLQDYYMAYGKYTPEMDKHKVKKRKVVSLGERVVLDQERCILCSRCVRFTHEVTKTHELGIFSRGDRSELGTFDDKPLNNNYSVNTVDICPVGALTSKDFRFKQRVWFLKEVDTVCNGCSTGCNVTVSYNTQGVFRVKPRTNPQVNGFWMCDTGRDVYKHTNTEYRLSKVAEYNPQVKNLVHGKPVAHALSDVVEILKTAGDALGVVVTAQQTNEEYAALFKLAVTDLKLKKVYYWKNNEDSFESFDGLLLRGDRNPNTKGLLKAAEEARLQLVPLKDLSKDLGSLKAVLVAGPEDQGVYADLAKVADSLNKVANVIWLSSCKNESFQKFRFQIPLKSFVEKTGTFTNFKGVEQSIKKGPTIVREALDLVEFSESITDVLHGKSPRVARLASGTALQAGGL